jgi:hypothetical protein
MPELSNLLRQRLEAGESISSVHPDPDTLTAYVERLLPSTERNGVVTHLSVCAQCREVVAFSLPQLPETALQGHAAVSASFWSRLWTPGFRWAGAMAVVAVAAALVVELPRHQQAVSQGSKSETAQTAPEVQQPKSAPASEQPAVSGLTQASADKATEGKTLASQPAPPPVRAEARMQPGLKDMQPAAAAAKKEVIGRQIAEETKSAGFITGATKQDAAKQDYVANYLFAANDAKTANFAYDNLPQAPVPQPGLASGPPAQIPIFAGISGTPDTIGNKKSKFRRLMPLTPLERLVCIFCKIADIGLGKSTPTSPAITSSAVVTSAMDVHGNVGATLLKDPPAMAAAAPEKSGSGGELDRSEAFVRRAAAATASPRPREAPPAQFHWKTEEGKLFKSVDLNQWEDAYSRTDANFEFSFVTAHGTDVWAGGSHAALVHSRDGGTLWEPVRLGGSASGKIVSIVASGLSVQVQTSTNQFWSSSDAGKTWVLQIGPD